MNIANLRHGLAQAKTNFPRSSEERATSALTSPLSLSPRYCCRESGVTVNFSVVIDGLH